MNMAERITEEEKKRIIIDLIKKDYLTKNQIIQIIKRGYV